MTENSTARRYQKVPEWSRDNGICETATYARVRRGELPHVRIGRKILIPSDALDQLVQGGRAVDSDAS